MASKKQNILFVGHKADRSGAPLLLLEIIKAFKKHSSIHFNILLMNNGELASEFSALGKTYIWFKKPMKKIPGKRSQNFAERVTAITRGLLILQKIKNTTTVFFNTIDNGHIHKKLLFLQCKYMYYIHESEAAIHMLTNNETRNVIFKNTDHFLAVSKAVKKNLIEKHNVDEKKISVVTTPIKRTEHSKITYEKFIAGFKAENNINKNAVIISVVGQNEWRKGFDMFFPLIKIYFQLFPQSNVFFIWKGFKQKNQSAFFDLYNYEKYELKDNVLILPHGKDATEVMACTDIHLLLSREDPFPLVTLEAATFAIPTICFADGGGSPEFVENDAGFCVPYSDLISVAEKINVLVNDAHLRNKLGAKAMEKVVQHSFEKTIPQFISIIQSIEANP